MMTHPETSILAQSVSPEALGVFRLESGREVFPDGSSTGISLNWALQTAQKMNMECRISGFWCFENPAATILAEMTDRHDFLLVQGRFIVDGWMSHVSGLSSHAVFDLESDADLLVVRSLYGDRNMWETSIDVKTRQVTPPHHDSEIFI